MSRVFSNHRSIHVLDYLTMNPRPPYPFMPWPWSAPRFTSMWNQINRENVTLPSNCSPVYRHSQQSANMNIRPSVFPGQPVYRRSPQTSANVSRFNFVPRQLLITNQARTSSISPSHAVSHSLQHNQTVAQQQVNQSRKRERVGSDSDEVNKPALSKPKICKPQDAAVDNWNRDTTHKDVTKFQEMRSNSYEVTKNMSSQEQHESINTLASFSMGMPSQHWTPSSQHTYISNQQAVKASKSDNQNRQAHQKWSDVDSRSSDRVDHSASSNTERRSNQHDGGNQSSGSNPEKHSKLYKRALLYSHFGKKHLKNKRSGVEFSVLSYNVLAQGLIADNGYLYTQCASDILQWNYRKSNLLREIKELNPDVLCLQEVQEDHFNNFFQPQLALLGYDGVYKRRTGNKHDGCATFHRRSKFDLVSHKLVEYYKKDAYPLDRDNVAVVVLLKPVKSKFSRQRVCIANTHLLFNPRRGDVKLAQLGILFSEIDKLAAKPATKKSVEYYPVILCGDMNSEPYSPLYKFISRGYFMYNGVAETSVSGQHRGYNGRTLPYPLWSQKMGVTDKCQYVSVAEDRKGKEKPMGDEEKTANEANKVKDNEDEDGWEVVIPKGMKHQFSDTIRHNFYFKSVYNHYALDNSREVTTNHDRTNCTVDYIFYSTTAEEREVKSRRGVVYFERCEGKLKLLSRLSLFSDRQASQMGGLPNHKISSDHFSLLATFLIEK
ncbi:protein angel homolog 2-like [Glandiceps talaboti]